MRCWFKLGFGTGPWLLLLARVLYSQVFVHSLPGPSLTAPGPPGSKVNALGERIDPPPGFQCSFRRGGQAKALISRDLYSATLHALLHFSLLDYRGHAETYTTRGSEPVGDVVVRAVPFALPVAATLNCYIAWGLYQSIIAYNVPDNRRETVASIKVHGYLVGDINYLQVAQAPEAAKAAIEEAPTNGTSATALQMMSSMINDPVEKAAVPSNPGGYRLSWHFVPNGGAIRRETAYDAVAYAILWTAQFSESTRFSGSRQLSVPGGRVVVRFNSFQTRRRDQLTLGFAATVVKSIPDYLEKSGHFREAFVVIEAQNGEVCGQVGIWNQEP